jgi:tetratricopeptide (TPR) repeat protein
MSEFKKEDLEKKVLDCKKRIKKDSNDSTAYYDLGGAYWELGLHKEAIEAFEQVNRITPDIDIVNDFLGRLCTQIGNHKEAIKAFNKVLSISPNNHYYDSVHCNLIESYLAIGDKKSALNEYNIIKNLDISLANEVVDKLGDRLFEKDIAGILNNNKNSIENQPDKINGNKPKDKKNSFINILLVAGIIIALIIFLQ